MNNKIKLLSHRAFGVRSVPTFTLLRFITALIRSGLE